MVSDEPIVLIGPGSEWFWAMAQFVVVAVTLLALYYQLRLQRHAAAVEQVRTISREWVQESMTRAKLEVLALIQAGAPVSRVLAAGGEIGDFWEDIAHLARSEAIDRRQVYDSLGPATRIWWVLLKDAAEYERNEVSDQGIWVDFEWLAGVFAEFDRKADEPAAYDWAYVSARIPGIIASNEVILARFEALRATTVRTAPQQRAARTTTAKPKD